MSDRITENMSSKALNFTYPGEELKKAIEDGRFEAEIKVCADTLYEGDFDAACAAVARTWQSNLCNAKKGIERYGANGTQGAMRLASKARAEAILEYVGGKRAATKKARTAGNGKAYWLYTVEDIEAVPLDELDKLTSIRDNMASKISKYPEKIEELMTMDEYRAIYKVACERRSQAAALAKKAPAPAAPAAPEVADALKLVETLKNGGKISKADKALLAQALELLAK